MKSNRLISHLISTIFQTSRHTILIVVLVIISTNAVSHEKNCKKITIGSMAEPKAVELVMQVMDEAYKKIGYCVIFKKYPPKRALVMSGSGAVDAELARTPLIEKSIPTLKRVPVSIWPVQIVAFTTKPEIVIHNIKDLQHLRIGVQRGYPWAKIVAKENNAVTVNTFKQLIELLLLGRIDVALYTKFEGTIDIGLNFPKAKIRTSDPLASFPVYHYLHQKNIHIIQELTPVLREMIKTGRIDEMTKTFIANLDTRVILSKNK